MKTHLNSLAQFIASACVILTTSTANAGSENGKAPILNAAYIEDVSPTERINLSGKLRMLSQRVPSAACHLAAGIDPKGSRALLEGAKTEFESILHALEFGSAELSVNGEETRRKTLMKVHTLGALWGPYQTTVDEVLAGETDAPRIQSLLTDSMTVLGSAKLLVSEISGQYSNPAEMTQSSAMVIDIAGRQRMLTQKIAKEACAAWSGLSDTVASDLAGTMQMFDASLTALINGMPEAGIKKPTNTTIEAGLTTVYQDWMDVKETQAAIAAGATPDAAEATRNYKGLNKTMVEINKVDGINTEAEKQGT